MMQLLCTRLPWLPRKSYDHIHSVVLADLGKPELLVRDAPKPQSFWELEPDLPVQAGGGALALDADMQMELVKVSLSPFKVPNDVYNALFRTPKVEELTRPVGNSRPLLVNPDLRMALEASYESSMATWSLGWHMTVLSQSCTTSVRGTLSLVQSLVGCTVLLKSLA